MVYLLLILKTIEIVNGVVYAENHIDSFIEQIFLVKLVTPIVYITFFILL